MKDTVMKKISLLFIALTLCGMTSWAVVAESFAGIITPAQLNDYTAQVTVTSSGFLFSREKKTSVGTITITNNGAAIDGTLVVLLNNLTTGVTTYANGTINGTPYILVKGGLASGASKSVGVFFNTPADATLTFTVTVNQLINGSVNARAVRALTRPFTIAALPDTQHYVDHADPAVTIAFNKQVKWVLNNAVSHNIAFVAHLGDVVEDGRDTVQWDKAMAALDPLLNQSALPFSIVRGNHDDPAFFLKYLPLSRTTDHPWFIEASPNGLSQAQVFRVQGACFLHVGFQYDPSAEELAWANALLAKPELQGLPVVVTTHDYLDGRGQSKIGRRIWNDFVRKNPMVFMVMNGHTHHEYAVVNHDNAGRPVFEMLSDYQDRANGGNGLMRLVTVDPVKAKILVKTFSPYYQKADANVFETDADSQFEYSVNVKERLAFDTIDFGGRLPAQGKGKGPCGASPFASPLPAGACGRIFDYGYAKSP